MTRAFNKPILLWLLTMVFMLVLLFSGQWPSVIVGGCFLLLIIHMERS